MLGNNNTQLNHVLLAPVQLSTKLPNGNVVNGELNDAMVLSNDLLTTFVSDGHHGLSVPEHS
jgi:hypothetical protein